MDPAADALRALLFPTPAVTIVACSQAPKARRNRCRKCPFGGAGLSPGEAAQAATLKAQLAARLAAGETVVWGCHESVQRGTPQVCAGFAEWASAD